MRAALAVTIAMLTFPSQAQQPSSVPPPIVAALKVAAAKTLNDPYSAQFERMSRATRPNMKGEPMDVVCGYVNAKNLYGAYVGARPFVFLVARDEFYIARPNSDADALIMPMLLKTFCTGLI